MFYVLPPHTDTRLLNEVLPKPLPPPDQSYTCTSDQPILTKLSENNNVSYTAVLELANVHIQAFNLNGTQFSPGKWYSYKFKDTKFSLDDRGIPKGHH